MRDIEPASASLTSRTSVAVEEYAYSACATARCDQAWYVVDFLDEFSNAFIYAAFRRCIGVLLSWDVELL